MKAVIDLGTNTFHLLIAIPAEPGAAGSLDNGKIRTIYRERRFIKLAEDGIKRIGRPAYQRGLDAMIAFGEELEKRGVSQYRAIGTAALRRAANGAEFIAEVKAKSGLQIELIDGTEEARLIAKGVLLTIPQLSNRPALIMDIGGGSVEFILVDNGQTVYAHSFPVGVAILRNQFHQQEPMSAKEQAALKQYLTEELQPLSTQLSTYPGIHLVGAAGVFEVLAICLKDATTPDQKAKSINLEALRQYHQRVLPTTLTQRIAMPDVPDKRADMMVVALELIQFVIDLCGTTQLTASAYALKEGVLVEME